MFSMYCSFVFAILFVNCMGASCVRNLILFSCLAHTYLFLLLCSGVSGGRGDWGASDGAQRQSAESVEAAGLHHSNFGGREGAVQSSQNEVQHAQVRDHLSCGSGGPSDSQAERCVLELLSAD